MKKTLLFAIAALLALTLTATAAHGETIGIISAMDSELKLLVENTVITSVDELDGITVYIGNLKGKDVALMKSGVGLVRAAASTTTFLENYEIDKVLFSGICGAAHHLGVLDVVVASKVYQSDYGRMEDREGCCPLQFLWEPDSGVNEDGSVNVDDDLSLLAFSAAQNVIGVEHVFYGPLASGDMFIASDTWCDYVYENFGALGVEMENFAIGYVCNTYGVPCAFIRVSSDSANNVASEDIDKWWEIAADNGALILMETLGLME